MSALEVRAQPFLRPLIAGTPSELEPAAQAAIATWAIKTAMVFEATRVEGDSFYFADDRKFVREHAERLTGQASSLRRSMETFRPSTTLNIFKFCCCFATRSSE